MISGSLSDSGCFSFYACPQVRVFGFGNALGDLLKCQFMCFEIGNFKPQKIFNFRFVLAFLDEAQVFCIL